MRTWILGALLAGLLIWWGGYLIWDRTGAEDSASQPEATAIVKEPPIRIILTGDIMLDRGVEQLTRRKGNGDYRFPFLHVAEYLQGADIVVGNLEGVISDQGRNVGSAYSFRVDPSAIEGLTYAGFTILNLANNHAFDYTGAALRDCLTRLHTAGFGTIGAGFTEDEAFGKTAPCQRIIGTTTIAFLAYTNLGPEGWRAVGEKAGIAWIDEDDFDAVAGAIAAAKAAADIVIVSMHAGEEYVEEPTRFQRAFARMAIDAGADAVIGHHPHIAQRTERHGDGFICYSLGNFIFDQHFSEETMRGQIAEIVIEEKRIESVTVRGITMNRWYQPELDSLPGVIVGEIAALQ